MKRFVGIILAFAMCIMLIGCEDVNISQNETNSSTGISLQEYNTNKNEHIVGDTYEKYGAKKATFFLNAIISNNIDKSYLKELEKCTSTIEMISLENKYIDVWKEELEYSIGVLNDLSTAEQTENFSYAQEKWLESLEANADVTQSFLENSIGRELRVQMLTECKKQYRERVFEIKYYAFMIEYTQGIIDDFTSLKFFYDLKNDDGNIGDSSMYSE